MTCYPFYDQAKYVQVFGAHFKAAEWSICVYLNDKQSNKKGLRQSNQLKGLILVVKAKKRKESALEYVNIHTICVYA